MTNTHLAQKKFDEAKNGKKFNGMNETELMEYHQWSFEELENYLFESVIQLPFLPFLTMNREKLPTVTGSTTT